MRYRSAKRLPKSACRQKYVIGRHWNADVKLQQVGFKVGIAECRPEFRGLNNNTS